jgi:hypothetical protein
MEEVVERLGSALMKMVLNKGAPHPDGMTVQALQAQWPHIAPKRGARRRRACRWRSWRPGSWPALG